MSESQPTVTDPGPAPAAPPAAPARPRRRWRWVLGLLALLVAAGVGAALWLRGRPQPDPTAEQLAAGDDEAAVAAEALIKGYLVSFRLDDLLGYAQGWIDRRPDDWPPYYLRGRAYLYARLLAKAIDDFRRVLALRPDHAAARLRLA